MTDARVLLVIPCFNEAESIGPLLDEIRACNAGYATLVVDDGSTDRTHEIAAAKSPTVRLIANLGIGAAVQVGIKYAARHGFDCCVQLDGDGQHPPDQIAKLLAARTRTQANIVVGSRYLGDGAFRSSRLRRFGSQIIGRTLALVFRTPPITDPTSGLRLLDRAAIELFAQRYPHDFPEPISLAWALGARLRIGECPVEMRPRRHGHSSLAGLRSLAYMVRVVGYIMLARMER
jgi:glycosyltransferase involved in cell wall biosynthesis